MSRPALLLGFAVAVAACGGGDNPRAGQPAATPTPPSGSALTRAGATFPNPIYGKWFSEYNKKTGVQINYQSIGSGGGIKQFTEGTVDFGATGRLDCYQAARLPSQSRRAGARDAHGSPFVRR